MTRLIQFALVLAGILLMLPVPPLFVSSWLGQSFGVTVVDTDVTIMMRHRAVLMGAIAVLLFVAVFRPSLRGAAVMVGLACASSLVLIAQVVGDYSIGMFRLVLIDFAAAVVLSFAGFAVWLGGTSRHG